MTLNKTETGLILKALIEHRPKSIEYKLACQKFIKDIEVKVGANNFNSAALIQAYFNTDKK